jgi:nicotinate-nucleotide adenylyltransferase
MADRTQTGQSPDRSLLSRGLSAGPVGILGGTFDPIHHGHLRLAEEVADELGFVQVRIIPARIPPHRATPSVTSAHRLEMVRLACAGNPRFQVDERECLREGPSYTVDTLTELRAELGDEQPLCLLMGVDAYQALTTWSRWEQLFALSHIIIAQRPGFELDAGQLPTALAREHLARRTRESADLRVEPRGRVLAMDIPPLEISATAIRAALREGRSARYLLPDAVLDYIDRNRLYKDFDAG